MDPPPPHRLDPPPPHLATMPFTILPLPTPTHYMSTTGHASFPLMHPPSHIFPYHASLPRPSSWHSYPPPPPIHAFHPTYPSRPPIHPLNTTTIPVSHPRKKIKTVHAPPLTTTSSSTEPSVFIQEQPHLQRHEAMKREEEQTEKNGNGMSTRIPSTSDTLLPPIDSTRIKAPPLPPPDPTEVTEDANFHGLDAAERRAIQNRVAQRAFRKRKDHYYRVLEAKSRFLDMVLERLDQRREQLKEARREVCTLRQRLAALDPDEINATTLPCPLPIHISSQEMQQEHGMDVNDDDLDFDAVYRQIQLERENKKR